MLHLRSALLAVLVHSQATSCLVAAPAARVHRSVAPQLRHSVPIGIATMPAAEPIAPEDEWIAKVDIPAFKADIKALGDRLEKGQGNEDVAHLEKIMRWSNICGGVGLLTCWMRPNPVSILALSTWTLSRWTMIGHHVCHGGYNKQDDGSGRFTSFGFALGSLKNRVRDWFDWMLPEAWNVEHNNLHHYRTGEPGDPDLVERNLELLRDIKIPRAIKYAVVAVMAGIWKWYYYAPNTYKQLKIQEMKKLGLPAPKEEDVHAAFALPTFFDKGAAEKFNFSFLDYFKKVMGPYLALRFFLMPAPLLLFGRAFYTNALINIALADVVSNLHSFLVISTNHAGKDLYKFDYSVVPKSGSFFMRQVITSVNFRTGNGEGGKVHGFRADLNDFFHGWLNFQIEHHLWPQLSMLSYQKAAPEVKAICAKHGVPYVQQNVFKRLKETADIMVGATSMRYFRPEWDRLEDRFEWK